MTGECGECAFVEELIKKNTVKFEGNPSIGHLLIVFQSPTFCVTQDVY